MVQAAALNSERTHWPPSGWLVNLFGIAAPVPQREYALFGVALSAIKYAVEAVAIYALTGKAYTPLDFVNPLLSARESFTADAPLWLGMAWALWTLPFLWIALTMSVRRAAYLGQSPWWGFVVLVPIVNLLGMAALALMPDPRTHTDDDAERLQHEREAEQVAEAYRAPLVEPVEPARKKSPTNGVVAALVGLAGGAGFLVLSVLVSVYVLDSYGAAMFFGTPVVTGAIAAYCLNARGCRSLGFTLGHGALTISCACVAFLAFGIEGAICIIMAIPIMVPLGLFGTLLGYGIAFGLRGMHRDESGGLLGVVLLLPLCGTVETHLHPEPVFENLSTIEINAPPEHVWNHVVTFSDIAETPEWYFRLGVAAPMRARIEGSGVGAVRHCEFTTGDFVEPITVWEPPRRLAFNVAQQPEPMSELSPYRHIHPPHLNGSFESLRGEFRLIPLSNGRTRLEGRTWYRLRIYPLAYWTIWTDAVIHRIHLRVLRHIQQESERGIETES
jgi:FtsH-binding integral membrane protein